MTGMSQKPQNFPPLPSGQIRRLKKAEIILSILLILGLVTDMSFPFVCMESPTALDQDHRLHTRVAGIIFHNFEVITDYGQVYEVEFTLNVELWNEGPFRNVVYSSMTNFRIPNLFQYSNTSTTQAEIEFLNTKDVGGMMCSQHQVGVGLHTYNFLCYFYIMNYTPPTTTSLYLPDGEYSFLFGDDSWGDRYGYTLESNNGTLTHNPETFPETWGDPRLNLWNPYAYIFGIPLLVVIIFHLMKSRDSKPI